MTQLRLRSSSVHESGSGSSSGAVSFMTVAPHPGLFFFMALAPDLAPAFLRFHATLLSIVLVCLKLNGK